MSGGTAPSGGPVSLRRLRSDDWPSVRSIYQSGIDSGNATFERVAPDWETWDAARHPDVRIVAVQGGRVVGFASVSPVSKRPVYAGVCEVMVYVDETVRGQGVGGTLMAELVRVSEAAGIWTLQASIFPENTASIRAHLRVGFREVGRRERIGRFHDGRWRDTVFVERRSSVVGTDGAADG